MHGIQASTYARNPYYILMRLSLEHNTPAGVEVSFGMQYAKFGTTVALIELIFMKYEEEAVVSVGGVFKPRESDNDVLGLDTTVEKRP